MNLNEMINQPYCAIHRKKLKKSDFDLILNFIARTLNDDPNERMLKINRLFIDQPDKPKNWLYISELLTMMNSREYAKRYSK